MTTCAAPKNSSRIKQPPFGFTYHAYTYKIRNPSKKSCIFIYIFHVLIYPKHTQGQGLSEEVLLCCPFQGYGSALCKKYPIRKAYLFGSYARGNATEKSDVDLRIEGDIKSFFMLGGIYSELSDALGAELDLLSRLPESEAFKENLKKDEVLLYER